LSIKSRNKRIGSIVGLTALAAVSQVTPAAFAVDDACVTSYSGAITVGNSLCEVTFLTTPGGAFSVPAGVTALQALLVAGGGAGSQGYSGGGGEVKVVDLQTTGDVTISVAAQAGAAEDGQDSSVTQGADTFTANGGQADGTSGNGNEGAFAGGGAGGDAGPDLAGDNGIGDLGVNSTDLPYYNGGAGLVVKDIDGATLFADETACYGGGGAGSGISSFGDDLLFAYNGVATCGAGSTTIDIAGDSFAAVAPVANSGGGAGASSNDSAARRGSSGRVVLRYTLPDETALANTGGSDATLPLILGIGTIAAGAFLRRRLSN
jgi:LPXTG-motif cell wall-anchored protein